MEDISIVAPLLNEEQNVPVLYDRLTKVLDGMQIKYEIIFVNDGSTDKTLVTVKELSLQDSRVKYIDFSRNFGHQIAVMAGLDHARANSVVIIDADLQDPPELIAPMYDILLTGFEVVRAKRKKRSGESFVKRITAKIFYRFLNRLAEIDIPLDTGDFRIMNRSVVEALKRMPEKHKFIRGQVSWIGFRQTFVEYERDSRFSGETKYPLKKMFKFAMDGITSFSTAPLKFATYLGFFTSGVAFVFIVWALVEWLLGNTVRGWTSQMVVILFLGGIQLISIGILGEYIGRINENIQNRPLYIIRQKSDNISN